MENNIKTLKELLHLTYNEDDKYIVSWKRPDFQANSEYESAEISMERFLGGIIIGYILGVLFKIIN